MELREEKFNSLLDDVMHGQFSPTPPADKCETSSPPGPSHHFQEEISIYSYTSPESDFYYCQMTGFATPSSNGDEAVEEIGKGGYISETSRLASVACSLRDRAFDLLIGKPDQRDSMAYSLSFAGSESDRSVVSPSLTPLQREQLASVTNMKLEDSNMDRRKYETDRLDTADSDMQEKFFEFVEQKSQQSGSLGYSLSFADCNSSINPIRRLANSVQQDQLNYVERRRMNDHMLMPRTYEEALAPSDQARVITEAFDPFRIAHVNGAWTDLCGYTLEDVRGKTLEIIQGRDTDPVELLLLESAIRARAEAETVLVNYGKDGRPFINRIRISPLKDKETGRVTHLLGVLKDVLQDETPIQMHI